MWLNCFLKLSKTVIYLYVNRSSGILRKTILMGSCNFSHRPASDVKEEVFRNVITWYTSREVLFYCCAVSCLGGRFSPTLHFLISVLWCSCLGLSRGLGLYQQHCHCLSFSFFCFFVFVFNNRLLIAKNMCSVVHSYKSCANIWVSGFTSSYNPSRSTGL